jgi:hypothetical protein
MGLVPLSTSATQISIVNLKVWKSNLATNTTKSPYIGGRCSLERNPGLILIRE